VPLLMRELGGISGGAPAGASAQPEGLLGVPFVSQWELADPSPDGNGDLQHATSWARRSCAIACVTMVLNYWEIPMRIAEVLSTALKAGAWDPLRCWMHGPLVGVIAQHGLVACRRNWRLLDGREAQYLAGRTVAEPQPELRWVRQQMLAEGLGTLTTLIHQGVPVIVSVYRPFEHFEAPGHQVVLLSADHERLVYHDPAEPDGQGCTISKEKFLRNWKGTALIAVPRGHQSLDVGYRAEIVNPSTG
jgi:hypothetical protein